eukprot:gb/GFBE01078840.1/.p1 GENE.gb/GFBE01078840.1/~~gb/GFBE01078840.1/.p1  ORF type:complete len:139 (+),score=30.34 gb/GFBE01078840.1/:1-417(+)
MVAAIALDENVQRYFAAGMVKQAKLASKRCSLLEVVYEVNEEDSAQGALVFNMCFRWPALRQKIFKAFLELVEVFCCKQPERSSCREVGTCSHARLAADSSAYRKRTMPAPRAVAPDGGPLRRIPRMQTLPIAEEAQG